MKEKQTNNKLNNKMIITGILLVLAVVIVCMILFFNKQEKYTINFKANGGTLVASIIVDKDGRIEKPEDPVREGYTFAGWYYNDEPFDFSKPITSDMELEARWVVDVDAEDVENKDDLEEDKNDDEKVEDNKPEDNKPENNKPENNKPEDNKPEDNKPEEPKEEEPEEEEPKEDDKIAVTGVSLDKTSLTLTEGGSSKLTATVNPSNATNKNVTWSSNNTGVATVDSNGNVTAIKAGTATITVTTADGNHTSTCTVTVNEKPANYEVTITPINQPGIPVYQYTVTVTKNGSSFSSWKGVVFNNGAVVKTGGTLSSEEYNSITSATIKLEDGTSVTATKVYK